jgi:hypothetical protein
MVSKDPVLALTGQKAINIPTNIRNFKRLRQTQQSFQLFNVMKQRCFNSYNTKRDGTMKRIG